VDVEGVLSRDTLADFLASNNEAAPVNAAELARRMSKIILAARARDKSGRRGRLPCDRYRVKSGL
jgi:hypothetical protein